MPLTGASTTPLKSNMLSWQPLTNICDPLSSDLEKGCHFKAFIELIKAGIHDLVFISTFIAIVVFIYAGFKLISAGMAGNSGGLKEARGTLGKVVTGYIIILAA